MEIGHVWTDGAKRPAKGAWWSRQSHPTLPFLLLELWQSIYDFNCDVCCSADADVTSEVLTPSFCLCSAVAPPMFPPSSLHLRRDPDPFFVHRSSYSPTELNTCTGTNEAEMTLAKVRGMVQ
eukprot:755227-Amphidinium_carterae.1